MDRKQILINANKIIHEKSPDAKVILFGSEARGTAHDNSDIDLLILVNEDKISLVDKQNISYPLFDLGFETGVTISPLIISRYDWENRPFKTPFYINVMNEGVEL